LEIIASKKNISYGLKGRKEVSKKSRIKEIGAKAHEKK